MDEAASKLRMEINSKPEELDVLDRKIMQLEIEIEAIKREDDKVKVKSLNADLANLKEERHEIFAQWESEKTVIDTIQKTKNDIIVTFVLDLSARALLDKLVFWTNFRIFLGLFPISN